MRLIATVQSRCLTEWVIFEYESIALLLSVVLKFVVDLHSLLLLLVILFLVLLSIFMCWHFRRNILTSLSLLKITKLLLISLLKWCTHFILLIYLLSLQSFRISRFGWTQVFLQIRIGALVFSGINWTLQLRRIAFFFIE